MIDITSKIYYEVKTLVERMKDNGATEAEASLLNCATEAEAIMMLDLNFKMKNLSEQVSLDDWKMIVSNVFNSGDISPIPLILIPNLLASIHIGNTPVTSLILPSKANSPINIVSLTAKFSYKDKSKDTIHTEAVYLFNLNS